MALPPGPKLPASLSLLTWMRRPVETLDQNFRTYGDLYSINNPLYGREVVVCHPELAREVLAGDPSLMLGGEANTTLSVVVGLRSVLVLDRSEHHRQRKLLLPPFHGERLAVYAQAIRRIASRVVRELPVDQPFSVLATFQRITFDVILETVFGASEGEEMDVLRARLLALIEKAQSPLGMLWLLPAMRVNLGPLTGWAAIKRSLAAADEAIYRLIARARALGAGGSDVLSLLLLARDEEGEGMTDLELRDEFMTLLLAGHETTAMALAWAVEEIVRRPETLAFLSRELASAADGKPAPYLDATFQEVLRLHPIAPLIARRAAAPCQLREYEIPAGTYLIACAHSVHRHPEFWDAPDDFRPERFLDKKAPHPYAFIPFGGGSRRCIGMAFAMLEARVILGTLFGETRVRLPGPPAKVKLRSFMFAPSGGPRIEVQRSS
jgi:cytochrome P450